MAYNYTTDYCFKGTLLKEPPLTREQVAQKIKDLVSFGPKRRWLHNGCAVEDFGRFAYWDTTKPDTLSALVYHIQDQLGKPQPIPNNDGYAPAGVNERGEKIFDPRFVVCALVDAHIKQGIGKMLEEYFGFRLLAPYFGNCDKPQYGNTSRIAFYGLCTTRYLADEDQPEGVTLAGSLGGAAPKKKRASTKRKPAAKKAVKRARVKRKAA